MLCWHPCSSSCALRQSVQADALARVHADQACALFEQTCVLQHASPISKAPAAVGLG